MPILRHRCFERFYSPLIRSLGPDCRDLLGSGRHHQWTLLESRLGNWTAYSMIRCSPRQRWWRQRSAAGSGARLAAQVPHWVSPMWSIPVSPSRFMMPARDFGSGDDPSDVLGRHRDNDPHPGTGLHRCRRWRTDRLSGWPVDTDAPGGPQTIAAMVSYSCARWD